MNVSVYGPSVFWCIALFFVLTPIAKNYSIFNDYRVLSAPCCLGVKFIFPYCILLSILFCYAGFEICSGLSRI